VEIKAIQAHYKGYKFRSRLEARWAIWLDNINEKWEYEAEGFQIGKMRYLPDFFLPDRNIFVEVKGPSYSDVDRQKVLALEEASKKYVIVVGDIPAPGEAIIPVDRNTKFSIKNWVSIEPFRTEKGHDPGGVLEYSGISADLKARVYHHVCKVCGSRDIHIDDGVMGVDAFGMRQPNANFAFRLHCQNNHRWEVGIFATPTALGFGISRYEECIECFGLTLTWGDIAMRDAACAAARSARFEHGETPK